MFAVNVLRLLGGLVAPTMLTTFVLLSAISPSSTTPPAGTLTFVSSQAKPEAGAQKLGDKLNCSHKSYRLKKSVWTWMCESKNKQRTYGFVHPDFADELYYATGKRCATSRQVWFVFAPNNWAIGVKTKAFGNTKALAYQVRSVTGGYVDYVCA